MCGELTRPVAAKDYWERGYVKPYLASVFNALLIDRKKIKVHQSPVDMMIREIGEAHSLIVFPEGGRNAEDGDRRVQKRPLLPGEEAARPGTGAGVTSITSTACCRAASSCRCRCLRCITFGPPIWLETGEAKNDFLVRAREAVRKLKET